MKIVSGLFAICSMIAVIIGTYGVFERMEFNSSDMLMLALGSALASALAQNFVKE